MITLETAILTKFAATSALTAAFTGNQRSDGFTIYWDEADKGAVAPYLVLQQLSANSTSKYGGVLFSEPVIRFKSVASGRATAITNIELVTATFDEFTPTLTSARVNNVTRTSDPVTTMYPPENASGATEWESVVDYQYSIS